MNKLLRLRQVLGLGEISQGRLRAFIRSREPRTVERGEVTTLALVVPCYNHAPFLATMLESVAQQTRKPDEVILVDDASGDGTADVLRSVAEEYGSAGVGLKIIENPRNIGQCASINNAVALCRSQLVMILNDDDYLFHDAVEVAIDLFGRNGGMHLLGATSVHFDSDDALAVQNKLIRNIVPPGEIPLWHSLPRDVPRYRNFNDLNMTHSGSCFTKAAWESVGGYNADKGKRVVPFSDRDFQLRVNALFPVAVSREVPFSFWRNNSSVDRGVDS